MAEDKKPSVEDRLNALEKENQNLKDQLKKVGSSKGIRSTALDITTEKSEEAKEAQASKGLYKFTFSKDHGTFKKDDSVEYPLSTAKALEAHKIGKVGDKVKRVEKAKQ